MSKKNKNPNRTGFLEYCRMIAGIERDKDEFCKAARIPRGGRDVFGDIDSVILDLNRRHSNGSMMISTYLSALDRVQRMIDTQNAHELKMAEAMMAKKQDNA